MTNTYDWLVIGGGLSGAALAYELQKIGLAVAIIEPQSLLLLQRQSSQSQAAAGLGSLPNLPPKLNITTATSTSYGGIPYWVDHHPVMADIARQTWQRYHTLTRELVSDTLPDLEFRTLDLLLTVPEGAPIPELSAHDPVAGSVTKLSWLNRAEVIALEPALAQSEPTALAGALLAKHGHVNPIKLIQGYLQSFQRLGGVMITARVTALKRDGCRVVGVETDQGNFYGMDVAVCSGGWSRRILQESGIANLAAAIYFTHAEVLELSPPDVVLSPKAMILPAVTDRFAIESAATAPEQVQHWQADHHEFLPPSLDIGAIPFQDGTLRFGQVSRVHSNPDLVINCHQSEMMLRQGMKLLLPQLSELPAHWYHTVVAFSQDSLPLVGGLPEPHNVHLFTGFTTPFAYVPGLAVMFAKLLAGASDLSHDLGDASDQDNTQDSDRANIRENIRENILALSPTRFGD